MRTDVLPLSPHKASAWRLLVIWAISLVSVAVFVTCIVLLSAIHVFGVDHSNVIDSSLFQSSDSRPAKIPKIVHQTWKTGLVPEKWKAIRENCMQIMPDFEFRLWTDTASRNFIATEYPWFLSTWDSYPYNIQRADAIRYFVLYKYGGIYMDLDIGCRAHPEALLAYDTILPVTKPIGVSNDLMFSVSGTPFLELIMSQLPRWNRHWFFMPYATVMFSTGPMFLSAMAAQWNRLRAHNLADSNMVRIALLPRSLYGKNVAVEDAPYAFFRHYYGSSWHASDANFVDFLGKQIYRMLSLAVFVIVVALILLRYTRSRAVSAPAVSSSAGMTYLGSSKHQLDNKLDPEVIATLQQSLAVRVADTPSETFRLSQFLRSIVEIAPVSNIGIRAARLRSLQSAQSQSSRPVVMRQRTRDMERSILRDIAKPVKPVLHKTWSSESILSDRSLNATKSTLLSESISTHVSAFSICNTSSEVTPPALNASSGPSLTRRLSSEGSIRVLGDCAPDLRTNGLATLSSARSFVGTSKTSLLPPEHPPRDRWLVRQRTRSTDQINQQRWLTSDY